MWPSQKTSTFISWISTTCTLNCFGWKKIENGPSANDISFEFELKKLIVNCISWIQPLHSFIIYVLRLLETWWSKLWTIREFWLLVFFQSSFTPCNHMLANISTFLQLSKSSILLHSIVSTKYFTLMYLSPYYIPS